MGSEGDVLGDVAAEVDTGVAPPAQPGCPLLDTQVLFVEEAAVHPVIRDDEGQHLGRDSRPLRMRFIVSSSAFMDPAGDAAVMIEAVDGHPSHEGAGAFGELDGFSDMVGVVLADLTVDIVDGEEGIEEGSGSLG